MIQFETMPAALTSNSPGVARGRKGATQAIGGGHHRCHCYKIKTYLLMT